MGHISPAEFYLRASIPLLGHIFKNLVLFQLVFYITFPLQYATYCLSHAMHGQNIGLKFTCVCVRHTFSQLAYRSDPSTDF